MRRTGQPPAEVAGFRASAGSLVQHQLCIPRVSHSAREGDPIRLHLCLCAPPFCAPPAGLSVRALKSLFDITAAEQADGQQRTISVRCAALG